MDDLGKIGFEYVGRTKPMTEKEVEMMIKGVAPIKYLSIEEIKKLYPTKEKRKK